MIIKTTFALFLTMYLFPLAKLEILHLDSFFIIQLLSEIVFGMIAGLMLQIVFAIVMMAGEQIAFTMGFTMASVLDPSSGTNMPITSQILHLIALLFFLAFDGHHLMLLFLSHSLGYINLGGFYPHENLMHYLNMGMLNIFIIGFTMSFPILGNFSFGRYYFWAFNENYATIQSFSNWLSYQDSFRICSSNSYFACDDAIF